MSSFFQLRYLHVHRLCFVEIPYGFSLYLEHIPLGLLNAALILLGIIGNEFPLLHFGCE